MEACVGRPNGLWKKAPKGGLREETPLKPYHFTLNHKERKSAINLSNLGNFCQIWARVIYLC